MRSIFRVGFHTRGDLLGYPFPHPFRIIASKKQDVDVRNANEMRTGLDRKWRLKGGKCVSIDKKNMIKKYYFTKKVLKNLVMSKKSSNFAPAFRQMIKS